jgi:hypothetical protein
MANTVRAGALKLFLDGDIDMLVDTIKVSLLDTGVYTYSAAHDFEDDLTGQVGTDQTLGTKTTTDGVFDAADAVWAGLTGNSVEGLWIYKDTGVPATSALICWMDTFASGMPYTPNGAEFTMAWNASGIFSI